jgi:hypothetical protein
MHHVYTNSLMKHNHFGFTPKKSTTDAAMAVKEFVEKGLRQGLITKLVSLEVRAAFDAAWWPSILKTLIEFNCPRNLYCLTKSYLSERTAVMNTNILQVELNKQRMSTRFLLLTRLLEYSIQLSSQLGV